MKTVTYDDLHHHMVDPEWWKENSNEASEARDFARGVLYLTMIGSIRCEVIHAIESVHRVYVPSMKENGEEYPFVESDTEATDIKQCAVF